MERKSTSRPAKPVDKGILKQKDGKIKKTWQNIIPISSFAGKWQELVKPLHSVSLLCVCVCVDGWELETEEGGREGDGQAQIGGR